MSDIPFHQTAMGRKFYEHTMPRLVEHLESLNQSLQQVAAQLRASAKNVEFDAAPDLNSGHGELAAAALTPDTPDHTDLDRPSVKLVGADGNALNILAVCTRAARAAGWSAVRIAAFRAEATSGDYDHLLRVMQSHFDVQ